MRTWPRIHPAETSERSELWRPRQCQLLKCVAVKRRAAQRGHCSRQREYTAGHSHEEHISAQCICVCENTMNYIIAIYTMRGVYSLFGLYIPHSPHIVRLCVCCWVADLSGIVNHPYIYIVDKLIVAHHLHPAQNATTYAILTYITAQTNKSKTHTRQDHWKSLHPIYEGFSHFIRILPQWQRECVMSFLFYIGLWQSQPTTDN